MVRLAHALAMLSILSASCASSGWKPLTAPELRAYTVPRWTTIANIYGWREVSIFARVNGPLNAEWWCPGVELWDNGERISARAADCVPFEDRESDYDPDLSWSWHLRLGAGLHEIEIRIVKAGRVLDTRELGLTIRGAAR